jgi:ketosteroid isomerase-like protein
MKKLLMVITLVFLLCISSGCEQSERVLVEPKADVEADIQAIKDIISELNAVVNAGDSDRFLPFCADDIVVIYPNEPAYVGKEANRSRDQQTFDEMILNDVYTVKDVKVSNDLAVAHFTWSTTVQFRENGKSDETNGNWIMVFERQPDGAWKVIYSIWSDEGLVRPTQAE